MNEPKKKPPQLAEARIALFKKALAVTGARTITPELVQQLNAFGLTLGKQRQPVTEPLAQIYLEPHLPECLKHLDAAKGDPVMTTPDTTNLIELTDTTIYQSQEESQAKPETVTKRRGRQSKQTKQGNSDAKSKNRAETNLLDDILELDKRKYRKPTEEDKEDNPELKENRIASIPIIEAWHRDLIELGKKLREEYWTGVDLEKVKFKPTTLEKEQAAKFGRWKSEIIDQIGATEQDRRKDPYSYLWPAIKTASLIDWLADQKITWKGNITYKQLYLIHTAYLSDTAERSKIKHIIQSIKEQAKQATMIGDDTGIRVSDAAVIEIRDRALGRKSDNKKKRNKKSKLPITINDVLARLVDNDISVLANPSIAALATELINSDTKKSREFITEIKRVNRDYIDLVLHNVNFILKKWDSHTK